MRTVLWISLGIVVVVALVVAGLGVGWALWGRQLWAASPPYAQDTRAPQDCGWGYGGRGSMMPWSVGPRGPFPGALCDDGEERAEPGDSGDITIEEAQAAVERYLASQALDDLEIAEVMEFSRNFYAIAREHDTDIGAMELLVDKDTGAVGPEIGPNMMWNTRYGMHRRGGRMGRSATPNAISAAEARDIAQRWLDEHRPGATVEEHVDPFHGYYTIHTRRDGEIEGMLSVHGTTGRVWYHTWHGEFIQMIESDEH